MLSILNSFKLSYRKFKAKKKKSLFITLPITFLILIIFVATTEAKSVISVVEQSVFQSLDNQNKVIQLSKTTTGQGDFQQAFRANQNSTDDNYTQADLDKINAITNIGVTQLVDSLPVREIHTSNLFDGKTISLTNVSGVASDFAKQYTNEVFDYTKDTTMIPIILNANDFKESYEEWNGKDTISIDLSQLIQRRGNRNSTTTATTVAPTTPAADPLAAQRPNQTRAISYDSKNLIGKEITVNFGGLETLRDYKQDVSQTGLTFTKLTADEIKTNEEARKTSLAKYWDYDKLSKPLSYTFKVVGVAEGDSKSMTYVPAAFTNAFMESYLNNEIAARNSTTLVTSDLNTTYQGLTYDGLYLKDDSTASFLAGARREFGGNPPAQRPQTGTSTTNRPVFRFGGEQDQTANIFVPGLVIEKNREDETTVGEYKGFDFTKVLPLETKTILATVNDSKNRSQVIADLNSKGYAYTDTSYTKQLDKLKSVIYTIVNIAALVLMAISGLLILMNMSKFVSDSRKEIGVFRALGNTKNDIRNIFMTQSFFYVFIGYALGIVLGVGAVFALSPFMNNMLASIVNTTIGEKIPITGSTTWLDFIKFDYKMIGIYTIVLIVVTLLTSLIPANNAAKISPITAIRSE